MPRLSPYFATPLAGLVFLAGCASNPDNMRAADISPLQYRNLDCEQIASEQARISRKVNSLYESLKTKADNDTWQMGVGLVLLWPVLFALEGGDGPEAGEYKQLKGEYEALEQVSLQKKCGLTFEPLDKQIKDKHKESSAQ
ncbi:MAG: metal ABC transporter ATP-binding protein [Bacteroidetes bacterium]|nr:metal ABC transporter ATP-binding protein [Bacteroidota bacterium]